jgi:hypothetical protein
VTPILHGVLTVSGATFTASFHALNSGLFIPGMPTDYLEIEEENGIGVKRSPAGKDDDENIPVPSKARRSSKKQQSARDGVNSGKIDSFDKRRPDLVLVDHSPEEAQQPWCLWRHFAVLLEMKHNPPETTWMERRSLTWWASLRTWLVFTWQLVLSFDIPSI